LDYAHHGAFFYFSSMNKLLSLAFAFFFVSAAAQPLRIATYQYADNNRIANIQPFADELKSKYSIDAEVKSYPTVHAFIDAIRKDEVDIALINTFGYFLLEASGKAYPMQPLLALEVSETAKDNYKTAFLANPSSPIRSFDGIKKAAAHTRLALVAKGSTSGNLVPRLALSYAGLPDAESSFAEVKYAGTHATAIDAILENKADLATMGLTEYQRYLAKDSSNARKLRLVWTSPEIPLGPVLFNKKLATGIRNKIQKAFTELHLQNPAALASIKAGWSEAKQATRYIEITDAFYDPFRKVLGNKEDLQRILRQFTD
jgi:phosphonate transport system substrate-binding protein